MFTNLYLRQKHLQQEILTLRLPGKYQNKTRIYLFKTLDKINLLLLYWARQDCIRGRYGLSLFEGLGVKLSSLEQQLLVPSVYMSIYCISELLRSSLSRQINARKKISLIVRESTLYRAGLHYSLLAGCRCCFGF